MRILHMHSCVLISVYYVYFYWLFVQYYLLDLAFNNSIILHLKV